MSISDPPIRSLAAALLFAVTLLTGCAVPLGPGFAHAARQIEVAPAATGPMQLRLQVTDKLVNNGDRDIGYLDLDLPSGPATTLSGLAVRVDGQVLQTSPRSSEPGAPQRIRFDPPWAPKQLRTVVLNYDLAAGPCACGVTATTQDGIYIADPSAFPAWLPPAGLFGEADWHARAGSLEVTVPAEFRVLAAGRERGTMRQGSLAQHQFRLGASNFPAYVIAGHYQERSVKTHHGQVIFWTFRPVDAAAARSAAERLAGTLAAYEQLFGPPAKHFGPLRIVEAPASSTILQAEDGGIVASSFPAGVLLDGRSVAQGIASEAVLERAEFEIARIWFGWHTRASSESQILLGRGISLFAVALAAEARGGEAARHQEIGRLLAAYDSSRQLAPSDALVGLPSGLSREQRETSAYRAALFLAALEDRAGRDNFDRALLRFLKAMAGQELTADELRSALEAASGSDFAAIFRTWVNHPGIPDDFRTRYGAAP